jgi:hypothetical protein
LSHLPSFPFGRINPLEVTSIARARISFARTTICGLDCSHAATQHVSICKIRKRWVSEYKVTISIRVRNKRSDDGSIPEKDAKLNPRAYRSATTGYLTRHFQGLVNPFTPGDNKTGAAQIRNTSDNGAPGPLNIPHCWS